MSRIGDRLRILRQSKRLSQEALGEKFQLSKSAVGMYERGDRRLTIELAKKLARFFDVPTTYLIGDDDDPEDNERQRADGIDPVTNEIPAWQLENDGPFVRLPVLGSIRAGQPMEMLRDIEEHENVEYELVRHKDAFILRVQGDSMIGDRIHDGDRVVVIYTPDYTAQDVCVVAIDDFEATLKRVKAHGDVCVLTPSNPTMEPMVYPADQVHVIGVVVEVRHRLKR